MRWRPHQQPASLRSCQSRASRFPSMSTRLRLSSSLALPRHWRRHGRTMIGTLLGFKGLLANATFKIISEQGLCRSWQPAVCQSVFSPSCSVDFDGAGQARACKVRAEQNTTQFAAGFAREGYHASTYSAKNFCPNDICCPAGISRPIACAALPGNTILVGCGRLIGDTMSVTLEKNVCHLCPEVRGLGAQSND